MNRQHHQQPGALPSLKLPPQQFTQPAGVCARLVSLKQRLVPQIAAFEAALHQALYGTDGTHGSGSADGTTS